MTLADSWAYAYAIPNRGIMQEFIKWTKHIKEVIEGLVEPAIDSTKHASMKSSKSNTKIPVATNIFFKASMLWGVSQCHSLIDRGHWKLVNKSAFSG